MATEVSSWGTLSGYKKETEEKKGASEKRVVTFDFLVGSPVGVESRDSNLGFQVSPFASENLLHKPRPTPARRQIQDLNLPPLPEGADNDGTTPPPQGFAALDLNVAAPVPSEHLHRSFCTIEFVKLALERFEREYGGKPRQGRMDGSPSSSPSLAATNSSIKRRWSQEGAVGGADGSDWIFGSLMAAGCPNCFFYVMVPWRDPRCPNCCSHVPVPAIYKKPRVRF